MDPGVPLARVKWNAKVDRGRLEQSHANLALQTIATMLKVRARETPLTPPGPSTWTTGTTRGSWEMLVCAGSNLPTF